jgi:hypothetical protein
VFFNPLFQGGLSRVHLLTAFTRDFPFPANIAGDRASPLLSGANKLEGQN